MVACTTSPPDKEKQPQVTVSPPSLTLLPGETSDPVTLSSSGFGGAATFSVSEVGAFNATLSPATLTDPATLTVAPKDGAAEGTYDFVVTGERGEIRASATLAVTLETNPEPQLSVPEGVNTTSARSPDLLFVRNTGSTRSTLLWRVSSNSDQVTLTPEEGTIEGKGSTGISVTVDASGLEEGETVNAVLSFSSNAGDADVAFSYRKTTEGLDRCGSYPSSFGGNSVSDGVSPSARAARPLTNAIPVPQTPYVPGELLVRYREPAGLSAKSKVKALERVAAAVGRDFGLVLEEPGGLHAPDLVRVAGATAFNRVSGEAAEMKAVDMEAVARRLEADPRVLYAEPNYYLHTLETRPNDEFLGDQWNLLDFGLPRAWDLETGENEVVVAVIDSGVDMNHEDLVDKMLPGCDFYNHDNDPNPGPRNGYAEHGTHVAGIAAAVGDNGLGVAGVAYGPGVKILPIKVFDETGLQASTNNLIDAVRWAAGLSVAGVAPNPNKADVINMSLGTKGQLSSVDEAMRQAAAAGVVLFASSGNAGGSSGTAQGAAILSPANAPDVIAVGAVNGDYRRAAFSDYATSGPTVDLMAPGGTSALALGCKAILSTFTSDAFGNSEYGCLQGTSMASPFAAGVAALVLSQNPNLSPQGVKAKLTGSAQFSPFMNRAEYGAGVVCADRALGASTRCGR